MLERVWVINGIHNGEIPILRGCLNEPGDDFQPGSAHHHPWFFFFLVYMNPGWLLFETCFANLGQLCSTQTDPSHSERGRKHVVLLASSIPVICLVIQPDLIAIRLHMRENSANRVRKEVAVCIIHLRFVVFETDNEVFDLCARPQT